MENLSPGLMGIFEKATPTLASSYAISRSVKIPVMCSSDINTHTAKLAMASGASGIGVEVSLDKASGRGGADGCLNATARGQALVQGTGEGV